MHAVTDALGQNLPHGLQLDVALLQPLLVTSRLLGHSSSNAAAAGSAAVTAFSIAAEEQVVACAEAARRSNNLGLAARLLQFQSSYSAEAGTLRHVPLSLRIAQAEVAWAESPHAAGRLAAAEQLAASLKAATVQSAEGVPTSKLRARGWLLLHSWLLRLDLPPLIVNELLSVSFASLTTPGDAVHPEGVLEQLAALDSLQLTAVQRASAACLRAGVSSDKHSSEAWRALGVWLSDFLQTQSSNALNAGDAASSEAAGPASPDARRMAFLAYCRSLRAAGLSQVRFDTQIFALCHSVLAYPDAGRSLMQPSAWTRWASR